MKGQPNKKVPNSATPGDAEMKSLVTKNFSAPGNYELESTHSNTLISLYSTMLLQFYPMAAKSAINPQPQNHTAYSLVPLLINPPEDNFVFSLGETQVTHTIGSRRHES